MTATKSTEHTNDSPHGATSDEPSAGISLKDQIAIVQSILTSLAILVGGGWFLFQDQAAPRANVEHQVEHGDFNQESIWISMKLVFENTGNVPINIDTTTHFVRRVSPVPSAMANGEPFSRRGRFLWPFLDCPNTRDGGAHYVQPGETIAIDYDCVVPRGVERIMLDSEIDSGQFDDHGNKLVWKTTSYHWLDRTPTTGENNDDPNDSG